MRWEGREASDNVEDRRGLGGGTMAAGGGIGVAVISLLVYLFTGDANSARQVDGAAGGVLGGGQQQTQQVDTRGPAQTGNAAEDQMARFVAVVLNDTEEVWGRLFREQLNTRYQEPKLVVFSRRTQTGCGPGSAELGPFYCPADKKLYIDLTFYQQKLAQQLGIRGDFALAYVIAHEVGHHVQNLMGVSDRVHAMRDRLSEQEYNELSVRLELQADFLAGVWAHHAQRQFRSLEEGDIEEAMRAAEAVGDDHIQLQSRGRVDPRAFTHGTSEQRKRWFLLGLRTGDISKGDTFNARQL